MTSVFCASYRCIALLFCLMAGIAFASGFDSTDKGDTIHLGLPSTPHTLNPFQIATADSAFVAENLFEGLVELTADGDLVPAQAESWRIENEGHRIVFTLRKGLRWSNGDLLTAGDFVEGFRYLANPDNGFMMTARLKMLKLVNMDAVTSKKLPPESLGVSAPDDLTLVINLDQPVDYAVDLLTNQYPLHSPTVKKYGEGWAKSGQMVVNGAYSLNNVVLNERLELKKNPYYRNAAAVKIPYAVVYPLSTDTELKYYEAGKIDITFSTVIPGKYQWLKKRFGSELKMHAQPGTYFYSFNLENPKVQDPRLRQALAYAIDRELITTKVTGYGYQPARTYAPPSTLNGIAPKHLPLLAMTQQEREVEAKRLYRESGHGPENPLTLEILYNTSENHKLIALAISDMWKRVLGVKTKLRNVEWNSLEAELFEKTFETVRTGWVMGGTNACFLYHIFIREARSNVSSYKSDAFAQQLQQACYSYDSDARAAALEKVETILAEDMPAIPIYHYVSVRLVKPRVQGFPEDKRYGIFKIRDWGLKPAI